MGELRDLDKNIHIIQNRKNTIESLSQISCKTINNKDLQVILTAVIISIKTQDIIEIKDKDFTLLKLPKLPKLKYWRALREIVESRAIRLRSWQAGEKWIRRS